MSHKTKDCMERPRSKGAKWTNKNIAADEKVWGGGGRGRPKAGCGGLRWASGAGRRPALAGALPCPLAAAAS